MASDARPKDSTKTLFETYISLLLSSIKLTVRVADIKLEPANLSPAAGAYTAPDAAVVLSWTVPEPEYYFNTAPGAGILCRAVLHSQRRRDVRDEDDHGNDGNDGDHSIGRHDRRGGGKLAREGHVGRRH